MDPLTRSLLLYSNGFMSTRSGIVSLTDEMSEFGFQMDENWLAKFPEDFFIFDREQVENNAFLCYFLVKMIKGSPFRLIFR